MIGKTHPVQDTGDMHHLCKGLEKKNVYFSNHLNKKH